VTGWAQLLYPYGSSVNDSYQKQLFDMYYVKNHNLFFDTKKGTLPFYGKITKNTM
jgi:lipopolysaccharide/colanic/teichoic acid biosynthesis glycosyltransferase